jgi:hypothetical protein
VSSGHFSIRELENEAQPAGRERSSSIKKNAFVFRLEVDDEPRSTMWPKRPQMLPERERTKSVENLFRGAAFNLERPLLKVRSTRVSMATIGH